MKTINYSAIAIILWLTTLSASGQLALSTIEKYSVGSSYSYWAADTTNFNTGIAGADITWDFDYLSKTQNEQNGQVLLPSQTQYENDFPNANEVRQDSYGNYFFLDRKSDTVKLVGFRQNFTNINIVYTQPPVFSINPFGFGDNHTGQTKYEYTFNNNQFVGGGTSVMKADGYGKLILDGKTYENVLRVKIEQNNSDTIKPFNTLVSESQTVSYRWYNQYNGVALLIMDSVIVKTQANTQKRLEILALKNSVGAVGLADVVEKDIKAVVQYDKIILSGLENEEITGIKVYDMVGKLITKAYTNKQNGIACLLPEVAKQGQLYIVYIETREKVHTLKLGVR
jgi:hypothetical protein